MRTSATSGLTYLIYIIIVILALTVLTYGLSETLDKENNSEKSPEKRANRCIYYGNACTGGHGKRFDPDSQLQQKNNILSNQKSKEFEKFLPRDELLVHRSNDKFRQELSQPIIRTRQNIQQYDPYNSSPYFLKRWMASNRRPHRRDLAVTDYK